MCQFEGKVNGKVSRYYRLSTIVEGEEAKKRNEQVRTLIISEKALKTMNPESNEDKEPFSRFFPPWYGGGAQFHIAQHMYTVYKL